MLDVGCEGGRAVVQRAERLPGASCVGVDVGSYSAGLAQRLIVGRCLGGRCEARLLRADRATDDGFDDVATSFLVVRAIAPVLKPSSFAAIARVLKPGGSFLITDETDPEMDDSLRAMSRRFFGLAPWYEVTGGNVVNTRSELRALCRDAGLRVSDETTFARYHILVAAKG